mmetsp:Transcript_17962/g.38323  ORF Transcript_17962/g.38323 Transcript_17962/m.38323 type:complete len:129 (+) Transcript_17962:2533-2919(+)
MPRQDTTISKVKKQKQKMTRTLKVSSAGMLEKATRMSSPVRAQIVNTVPKSIKNFCSAIRRDESTSLTRQPSKLVACLAVGLLVFAPNWSETLRDDELLVVVPLDNSEHRFVLTNDSAKPPDVVAVDS